MKRYAKPNTDISTVTKASEVETPALSDISIDRLIDDSLVALYREIKNILILSAKGKLDPASAKDLRDHLKLLFELKAREGSSLAELTDDQIKQQAADALKVPANDE